MWTLAITAGGSIVTAVAVAMATYVLTKKREREAEWRKLKFDQYREYILALSGVVSSRSSQEAQARYADAINSMYLIAPSQVVQALQSFQDEISYMNRTRRATEHDRRLGELFRALRDDIHPSLSRQDEAIVFRLLDIPPRPSEQSSEA